MLLTPCEILTHLGFDIPEGGVEINPHDAYLLTTALQLAGKTIDVERIPEPELAQMRVGTFAAARAANDAMGLRPLPEPNAFDESSSLKSRAVIDVTLRQTFKRKS